MAPAGTGPDSGGRPGWLLFSKPVSTQLRRDVTLSPVQVAKAAHDTPADVALSVSDGQMSITGSRAALAELAALLAEPGAPR